MATIRDVEESFEFWVNYSKGGSVLSDVLQKALQLMEEVVEKLVEEEGAQLFSPELDKIPKDKVLGEKTQIAFNKFSKLIDRYRAN